MSSDQQKCAIESMPHLVRKISLMWGQPELDVFFASLIMDSRDGTRQGFPIDVAAEIMFLTQLNKVVRAIDMAKGTRSSLKDAYALVEAGDQSRLEADALDNPLVSRDTIRRDWAGGHKARPARRETARTASRSSNPISLLGSLIVALIFNKKLLIIFIVTALGLKAIWPSISPHLAAFLR